MTTNHSERIDVVAGLIWRDKRILVCQRSAVSAFPLKWEFPGGKVEASEADEEALRRELKEELGIDVLEYCPIYQHEHTYAGGPTVSLRFFKIVQFRGLVQNLVFHNIVWVDLEQLAALDFLDGDKPFIEKLTAAGGADFLR